MNRDAFAAGHKWENKVKEVKYDVSFEGVDEISARIKSGDIVLAEGEAATMRLQMNITKTESPDPKFI